jgi:hypothetical protein
LNGNLVKRLRLLDEIRRAMLALQQPPVYGAWLTTLAAQTDVHVARYGPYGGGEA